MHRPRRQGLDQEHRAEHQAQEQQRVLDRPVGHQVAVHRFHQAQAEGALEHALAAAVGGLAGCQGLRHPARQPRHRPAGTEAGLADLALVRQVVAFEARMRPVTVQADRGLAAHRHPGQGAGAGQVQIHRKRQVAVQGRQRYRRVQAFAQPGHTRARLDGGGLAGQFQADPAHAAVVAQAQHQPGALGLQLAQVHRRRLVPEPALERLAGVEDGHAEQAAAAAFAAQAAGHGQLPGRHQVVVGLHRFLGFLAHVAVAVHHPPVFGAVFGLHQQQRADQGLFAGRGPGDLGRDLLPALLALVHQPAEHHQRHQQQQQQQPDQGQFPSDAHGAIPRFSPPSAARAMETGGSGRTTAVKWQNAGGSGRAPFQR